MENIGKIKKHFNFTVADAENLHKLHPIMEKYQEQAADLVHKSMAEYSESPNFVSAEDSIDKRKTSLSKWFINLFNGTYDHSYYLSIKNIGNTHVNIGLEPHFRNVSISLIRGFCLDILESQIEDSNERATMIKSLDKIIDINQDIMASSYSNKLLSNLSSKHKFEGFLIHLSERFTYGLNLVLVIALMILSLVVIGLFGLDIWKLATGHMEHGIVHILGTLLMLWVMIELMDTEIEHLKQGKFSITIFVEVALVAIIRDLLIATLEHGALLRQATLVGSILILGCVYWLISRTDTRRSSKK